MKKHTNKQESPLINSNNYYNTLISSISNLKSFPFKIFVKTIYHSVDIKSERLYNNISSLNSNYLIEELSDRNILNVLISLSNDSFTVYNPGFEKEIISTADYNLKKIFLYSLLRNNYKLSNDNINVESFSELLFNAYLYKAISNLNIFNVSYLYYVMLMYYSLFILITNQSKIQQTQR